MCPECFLCLRHTVEGGVASDVLGPTRAGRYSATEERGLNTAHEELHVRGTQQKRGAIPLGCMEDVGFMPQVTATAGCVRAEPTRSRETPGHGLDLLEKWR